MGYMHIDNLYKDQTVLMFREVYALEKIHGTSAHVAWDGSAVRLFAGGEKHERFAKLFTQDLPELFSALGHDNVTVYGEAYGGRQQGQAHRYGPDLRFVAFDVKIGDTWLDVPDACDVATNLGLDFVHYVRVPAEVAALDAERDAPSVQAKWNGVEGDKGREGIVIRPIHEVTTKNGARIIAKHKTDEFRETATPRTVDPEKAAALADATKIAFEWVTPMRLSHVLDKLESGGVKAGVERMRDVIAAMQEDVAREGAGEFVDSRDARAAIGRRTSELFMARLKKDVFG